METMKITRNGAVTLPAKFRKLLGLKVGDHVKAELENNRIVIKPVKIIDAEDAFFYTRDWQKGEAEADRDIAEGRVSEPVSSSDELIDELED